MRSVIVIPARMGSVRFPGKPLTDLCGKPMVQWVYEASVASRAGERVVVATPDHEIADACRAFGAEAVMTSDAHASGTDRLAEVAESVVADTYVNVQGDEPLVDPATILACVKPLFADPAVQVGSAYCPCPESEEGDTSVVKVVTDADDNALYFSRYPVPFARNARPVPVKKHIGIYAYTRSALQSFASWLPTPLERAESLEQLRFLEHGVRIRLSLGKGTEVSVDTPAQAETVRAILTLRR